MTKTERLEAKIETAKLRLTAIQFIADLGAAQDAARTAARQADEAAFRVALGTVTAATERAFEALPDRAT